MPSVPGAGRPLVVREILGLEVAVQPVAADHHGRTIVGHEAIVDVAPTGAQSSRAWRSHRALFKVSSAWVTRVVVPSVVPSNRPR